MKKISLLLLGTLLFLSSCAPDVQEDEVVKDDEQEKEEVSIVPSQQLESDNYRFVLPYRPSAARGVIVNQVANRLDIDEMEEGLRRLSKDYYDPEEYLFEEGQYLSENTVYSWLGRELTDDQLEREVSKEVERLEKANMTVDEDKIRQDLQNGLNPPIKDEKKKKSHEDSPKYLSHILEQNYLVQDEEDDNVSLEGISIGLAMKSVYHFQTEEGGPDYNEKISKEEILSEGQEIADDVLERVRDIEGLEKIPIMIAIYREEEQSSPVPGNFVSTGYVEAGETSVDEWEDINEEFVLFPSDEAKEDHADENQAVNNFSNEIAKYFPNYVGVVGEGQYFNKELKQLSVEVPIEFFGKGEVTGFTQYAYAKAQDIFDDYYDLEIKITSGNDVESFIYREAGEKEMNVHIFH